MNQYSSTGSMCDNGCVKEKLTYGTKVDCIELVECENVFLKVNRNDCVIRRDVNVDLKKYQRIYGTVLDRLETPKKDVLMCLIKYEKICGTLERQIIEYCTTDSLGSFSFLVPKDNSLNEYKVEICNIIKDC